MLEKSEVQDLLKNFCVMAEKQFNKSVRAIRSDNGSKFMVLSSYFRQHGIAHQTSCVDTPQQNGRVERTHQHILNVARALLFQANLPVMFWGESILTAAHFINRTPSPLLHGQTPYALLHGSAPSYDTLRTFGYLCYAHRRDRTKDKFADRSRKCLFVGYPHGKKAWHLYDINTNEFFSSRDVVFFEDKFPSYSDSHSATPIPISPDLTIDDWTFPLISSTPLTTPSSDISTAPVPVTTTDIAPLPTPLPSTPTASTLPTLPDATPHSPYSSTATTPGTHITTEDAHSPGLPELLGRGKRVHKPSVLLKDYVVHATLASTPLSLDTSSSSQGLCNSVSCKTPYPISDYLSRANFSPGHKAFLATVTSHAEPRSYSETSMDDVWNDSMTDEYTALENQHTWNVTTLPPGKRAIGCDWVYKYKYDASGKVVRHKSHLVAHGNRQQERLDYTDMFAPVAKPTTVRFLLRVAAAKN